MVGVGHREGGDGVLALAPDPQGRAAGDEHGEVRAGAEQVDHLGRRFGHVLEVIEQQEGFPFAQVLAEDLQRVHARSFPQAQGPRDGRHHERRVAQGRQGDEGHAVGEVAAAGLARRFDGQAGLADAPGTRERQQPDGRPAEQADYLLHLALPAQQAGEGRRQGGRKRGRCLEGDRGTAASPGYRPDEDGALPF
jgi:hypothetical protein